MDESYSRRFWTEMVGYPITGVIYCANGHIAVCNDFEMRFITPSFDFELGKIQSRDSDTRKATPY